MNAAKKHTATPKINTGIYKKCSLLLNAEYITMGPKNIQGRLTARYRKPLFISVLLKLILYFNSITLSEYISLALNLKSSGLPTD